MESCSEIWYSKENSSGKICSRVNSGVSARKSTRDQKMKGVVSGLFSTVLSAALQGMRAEFIHVEADVGNGLPFFHMVGHLASEVKESAERVRTAIKNSGIQIPPRKVVINLSPANVRKRGAAFDLPIAAAVLAANGVICQEIFAEMLVIGELSLDGGIKKVPGILPILLAAKESGCTRCMIPKANEKEGRLIPGMEVIGVSKLTEVVEISRKIEREGELFVWEVSPEKQSECFEAGNHSSVDFSEIKGQTFVKRAAEIAVAGQHNLLMIGPPGAGKTMAARRIPTIFPPLSMEERMEISKIYSVAGRLDEEHPLIAERPFCAVHHTVTKAALVGGGLHPVPGELSLSHGGCLFLDEAAEFRRDVLEALREPMEEQKIHIVRNGGTYVFPADTIIVAAMNPCPCGQFPDYNKCRCSEQEIRSYLGRISGPLLDRIDLCVDVPKVEYESLVTTKEEERSECIRERVCRARAVQKARYQGLEKQTNGRVAVKELMKDCVLDKESEMRMRRSFESLQLTARSYYKVLRVARTIADLAGSNRIEPCHLDEALIYRTMDQKYWR